MALYSIGEISKLTGFSGDTLRYYEKIGLLGIVPRNAAGRRSYGEKQVSHLKFILRAKKMNFSLHEIGSLLKMRSAPQQAKEEIRLLTANKLQAVENHLSELTLLRNELTLLLNLCRSGGADCPIIDAMDKD